MPLLDTPDCRQRDSFSCGVTAVETVLRFDGLPVGRWIKQLASPIVGTTAETVVALIHGAYAGDVLAGAMSVPLLKFLTAQGRPVLALVTDPATDGGHWVVVRGIFRGRVHVHCPTNGRESHRAAEFDKNWYLSDFAGGWVLRRYGVVALPPT